MDKRDKTLGKWSPSWEGLFRVIQEFTNNIYKIKELTPDGKTLWINGNYSKKYKSTLQEIHINEE